MVEVVGTVYTERGKETYSFAEKRYFYEYRKLQAKRKLLLWYK